MKLFSLSSNTKLAEAVCEYISSRYARSANDEIHLADRVLTSFADGEIFFESKDPVRGEDVFILQSTCTPVNDRLMELLIAIDALKRASAKSITCIIPYFGYARQDRKGSLRQAVSAKLVANLISKAGADRVICFDLHAAQIVGFFDIPVDNISAIHLFYNRFKRENLEDVVCVSPDHGGVVRTTSLASKLNVPIAIIDKRRPKPNQCEIVSVVGDIKDKHCIIVDDIVDTAGTLCNAANELKKLGAKYVEACITHGVLSGDAINKINESQLDKLVITDSIPLNSSSDKIEVLSLAPLLGNIIYALKDNHPLWDVIKRFEGLNYLGE